MTVTTLTKMLLPLILSPFLITTTALILIFPIYWLYVRYFCHTFWTRKFNVVPQLNPSNIFGNYGKVIRGKRNIGEHLETLYNGSEGPLAGTYFLSKPILLVKDPELIEKVITDDTHFKTPFFDKFFGEELSPKLTIDRRNEILAKISASLTPNTLSSVHETLRHTVVNLLAWMHDELHSNSSKIDINEMVSRYSLDLIGNIAFGTEVHSISNPNVTFRKMTVKLMRSQCKRRLIGYSPLAGIWRVNDGHEADEFFDSLVKLEVNYREDNRLERRDLLQLILQLRNGNKFRDGRWKLVVQDNGE